MAAQVAGSQRKALDEARDGIPESAGLIGEPPALLGVGAPVLPDDQRVD